MRGSLKGYLTLTSNRPSLIIQALQNQGPVSVGLCGTDQSFLYYGGGIYDDGDCCTTLNHAMLIVGYGK